MGSISSSARALQAWSSVLVWLIAANGLPSVLSQPGQLSEEQPVQFVPSELGGAVPARLVFRPDGFASAWNNPDIRTIVLQNDITIEESFWRQQFPSTGGVAVMGPERKLPNYTITSRACEAIDCSSPAHVDFHGNGTGSPDIGVRGMTNFMLVEPGGLLVIENVNLLEIALAPSYIYSSFQPYKSVGVGTGTWPTIALAPNATLVMSNVTLAYRNPSSLDTCEMYTSRAVFSLQQVYGSNITAFNATAGRLIGPITITVRVLDGASNSTLGEAQATYSNVTFSCLPYVAPTSQGGLAPGLLAVAIAVPVGVVLLLAGCTACFLLRRRRRRQRREATAVVKPGAFYDPESGCRDVNSAVDQYDEDNRDRVLPLSGRQDATVLVGGPPSTQSHSTHSYSTYGSAASAATSASSTAPTLHGAGQPAALAHTQPSRQAVAIYPTAAAAAVGAAAAAGIPSHYPHRDPAVSSRAAPAVGYANRPSTSSAESPSNVDTMGSIGPADPAWNHPESKAASSELRGSGHAGSSGGGQGGGSGGGNASGGGAGVGDAAEHSRGAAGGQSCGEAGGSGGSTSLTAAERRAAMPALLKARSEMAVLRDLKIGPLLGRGSYGRVYKGRWKAVTVAVKIIEHNERTPGTASSGGKRINIGRESLLATNMSHPNVVQTYHISTMTVSQRNSLANGMLVEEGSSGAAPKQPKPRRKSGSTLHADDTLDNSNHSSSDGEQRDPLETWMLMEYCEKGSLERAVARGKFIRREDRQPEMIGIYKVLLDTASGLDYLHSIGVVHGDLKTANVLLKGSARDVRGFACKISDFGLSRVLDMDATHISTRTYGTIVYMPSELLLTGRMTTGTDIYSFGLMMWELLTSSRVFDEGLSIGQIFYMIAYQNWRPVVPPNCPPGYAQLMTACWHENPEQRPTVQQLLRTLQKLYVAEKQHLAAERAAADRAAARISIDSTVSDRYGHAAAAGAVLGEAAHTAPPATTSTQSSNPQIGSSTSAGQPAVLDASRQQVTMPQTLGNVTSSSGAYDGSGGVAGAAAAGSTGAAAAAAAAATARAAFGAPRSQCAGGDAATGNSNLAQSSGGAGGRGSAGSVEGLTGSGGRGHLTGSGGSDGHEEYQPWAAAVSQGSVSGSRGSLAADVTGIRRPSATNMGSQTSPRHLLMQQQVAEQWMGPAQGPSGPRPLGTSRYSTGIEPVLDSEAVLSGGSALQNLSNSSSSNAAAYGTAPEDMHDDVSGFLENTRRPPSYPFGQQQQQAARVLGSTPAQAAQGFLEALESVQGPPGLQATTSPAMPMRGWQPALQTLSTGQAVPAGQTPSAFQTYQQYQPQQGLGMAGAALHPASSGSLNLHEVSSGYSNWPTVATGAMPATLGDGSSSTFQNSSSYGALPPSSSYSSTPPGKGAAAAGTWGHWIHPEQYSGGDRLANSSNSGRSVAAGATAAAAAQQGGISGTGAGQEHAQLAAPSGWFSGRAAAAAAAPADSSSGGSVPSSGGGCGNGGLLRKVVGGSRRLATPPPAAAVEMSTPSAGSTAGSTGDAAGFGNSAVDSLEQTAAAAPSGHAASAAAAATVGSQAAREVESMSRSAQQAGTMRSGPAVSASPVGVLHGSLYPSTSLGVLQTVTEVPSPDESSASVPLVRPADGTTQQGQQQPIARSRTPPPSPFAALAQRAGSLFRPL